MPDVFFFYVIPCQFCLFHIPIHTLCSIIISSAISLLVHIEERRTIIHRADNSSNKQIDIVFCARSTFVYQYRCSANVRIRASPLFKLLHTRMHMHHSISSALFFLSHSILYGNTKYNVCNHARERERGKKDTRRFILFFTITNFHR